MSNTAAAVAAMSSTINSSVNASELNDENSAKNKIFVGNLSFQTKESDLAKFLEPVGAVTNVNIITFRDRSMGYGFVTFETEQQASKAVDSMNKKELNGRPVNLEIADENRRGTSRKPRGRRGRGSHRRAGSTHSDSGTASAPSGDVQSDEPSETSLFVGNIPWTMDEEGFSNLFAAFGPAKARIIRRRNGMSKGFGFVEFSSHDAQQRALSEMKEFEVDGRKLSIRVAIGHAIESHSPSSDATVSTAKESPSQN